MKKAKVSPSDGDRHVEAVATGVSVHDLTFGNALGAGGPDEVEVHHFEHAVPDEPKNAGDVTRTR